MLKKLLLVVGTFAVLIGGLVVYRQFAGTDLYVPVQQPVEKIEFDGETGEVDGFRVGSSPELWVVEVDPITGRREAVYEAAKLTPGAQHVLTEPKFTLYYKSGETVRITSRTATVTGEHVGGRFVPRRGTLLGDVHISIDMNPMREDRKAPPEQRPEDFIDIRTDRMLYNSDLQEIVGPDRVEMITPEAKIFGSDLLLRWDTAPDRELRSLQLARGDRMEVRAGAAGLDRMRGSGGARGPQTQPAPATPERDADADADAPRPRRYSIVLNENVAIDAGDQQLDGADVLELLFTVAGADDSPKRPKPRSRPSTTPAAVVSTRPAVEDSGELIVITWTGPLLMTPLKASDGRKAPAPGEYAITAEGERLLLQEKDMKAACRRLAYDSGSEIGLLSAAADENVTLEFGADGQQVISPIIEINRATEVVTLRGPGEILLGDGDGASLLPVVAKSVAAPAVATTAAATRPASEAEAAPAPVRPAKIEWTGSARMEYAIGPDGPDGPGKAYAKKIEFRGDVDSDDSAAGVGVDDPAGGVLTADELDVFFYSPASAPQLAAQQAAASSQPATQASSKPTARASTRPTSTPATRPSGADDRIDAPKVSRIVARGDVRLDEAGSSNFISTDHLEVSTGIDAEGVVPEKATATGRVLARQDDGEITADTLVVTFGTGPIGDDGKRSFEAVKLEAAGNVEFTGADAKVESGVVSVAGETLVGDPRIGSYDITGAPNVRMEYGDGWIEGPTVRVVVDPKTRRVKDVVVVGAGVGRFLLSNDLGGELLDTPRPTFIRWDKQVTFDDLKDELLFEGAIRLDSADGLVLEALDDVKFDSPGDHLRCEEMTLTVVENDADAAEADDEDIGITKVHAVTNVRLLRRWHDQDGYLVNRVQLTGDDLTFDIDKADMVVDGPGTMIVEDYGVDEAGAESTRAPGAGVEQQVDRPSQTAFQWDRKMHLLESVRSEPDPAAVDRQGRRPLWIATLEGKVMMRHRSGEKIPNLAKLAIRPIETLPAGRVTEVDCGRMMIQFVEKSSAEARDSEPRTSPSPDSLSVDLALDLFEAVDKVLFRDGPVEAHCGRMVFNRRSNVAVVYGDSGEVPTDPEKIDDFLRSQRPRSNARVFYEPTRRRPQGRWTVHPIIVMERKGDNYEVRTVGARGGSRR